MNKNRTGKITKIIDNEDGTYFLEISTIPNVINYKECLLQFELAYDKNANNFPFSENDMVRFNEDNIYEMVKMPSADFDYLELTALVNVAKTLKEEEIEELHQSLMGLTFESEGIYLSAAEEFIYMLVNYDFGKISPVDMPIEYIKFFNSEYISNFYKTMLMEKVIIPNNITNVNLSEDKCLKYLTGEEWNILYEAIKNNPVNFSRGQDFCNGLFPLAFQIDSDGARDFLNNYVDQKMVIKRIMYTSGLTPDPSYYSGRGTRFGDLNQFTLLSIFLKLERLDENKGLAMAELAYSMPTLGATEFVTSLFNLEAANYDMTELNMVRSNISLDGATNHDEALGILLMSYAESLVHDTCESDFLTRQIKIDFIDLHNRYLIDKYLVDGSKDLDETIEGGIRLRIR